MRRPPILYALLTVAVLSCSKKDLGSEVPGCVREIISELEANDNVREGTTVSEYLFERRHVYVQNMGNVAFVYDENCDTIGLLGGFAGNTKVNGQDFANAKFIREIWRRGQD